MVGLCGMGLDVGGVCEVGKGVGVCVGVYVAFVWAWVLFLHRYVCGVWRGCGYFVWQ